MFPPDFFWEGYLVEVGFKTITGNSSPFFLDHTILYTIPKKKGEEVPIMVLEPHISNIMLENNLKEGEKRVIKLILKVIY